MNSQLIITVLSIVVSTVATSFVVINFLLARIDKLDDKLSKRIDHVEQKIDQVEQKLEAKISQVEQKLEAKISQVEQKLEAKIDQVEQKLEAKIDNLQESFANVRIEIAKLEVYIFGGAKSFKPSSNQISELES